MKKESAASARKESTPPPAPVTQTVPKAGKGEIVLVLKNKMSEEEGENAIQSVLKKMGGRVPKGSKLTLASNVDNLKKKMAGIETDKDKMEALYNAQIAQNFDLQKERDDSKAKAEQMEQKAQNALTSARNAEKKAAEKQAEFERKIQVRTKYTYLMRARPLY